MKTKRLVILALFATIALTIFTIESALPPLLPIPGIKLGLANVITLILLMFFKPSEVFLVLLVRILLGSIFGGQMMSFFYSLCGGIFCFCVMSLLTRILKKKYLPLISIGGAIAHNLGQLLVAYVVMDSAGVFAYLPVLMISGVITGLFTGLIAAAVCRYIKWK